MKNRIAIMALAIIALLTILIIGFQEPAKCYTPPAKMSFDDYTLSAERGINWLLQTNKSFESGGVLLIKNINRICKDPRLEELYQEKADEYLRPIDLKYSKIYGTRSWHNLTLDELSWKHFLELQDRVLENVTGNYTSYVLTEYAIARAEYCRNYALTDEEFNTMLLLDNDNAYNTTHLLWALDILKENNCYDPAKVNAEISRISSKLAGLQNCHANIRKRAGLDLYAENAAFLQMVGYSEFNNYWLDVLVENQNPDGSWSYVDNYKYGNVHSTGLAVWALVQRTGKCKAVRNSE